MFKSAKGLAPRYLCSRFVTRATVYDRNTRNKNKLEIPGHKSSAGQQSFLYWSVTMWNQLPTTITNCNSHEMFKGNWKTIFSNSSFKIVNYIIARWLLYICKLGQKQ